MAPLTAFTLQFMAISDQERAFFLDLGQRISLLRKSLDITQATLAGTLGISQQTLQAYEVGRRRPPVSSLRPIARALAVSLEELLGDDPAAKPSARRGPTPRLQQQIDLISQLPKPKQRFVMEMLDTVLAQQTR